MPSRIVVDTSGAYYKLLGSKEMKEAFDSAVGDSKFYISTLIRMEWLRGVVLTLIDAYSVVKESDSVADALIDIANSPEFVGMQIWESFFSKSHV